MTGKSRQCLLVSTDFMRNCLDPASLRFSVYDLECPNRMGSAVSYSFIVLASGPILVMFTGLEAYAGKSRRIVRAQSSGTHTRMTFICLFLNFLAQASPFRLEEASPDEWLDRLLLAITKDAMQSFFDSYASERPAHGTPRSRDTLVQCIRGVTSFVDTLCRDYPNGDTIPAGKEGLYSSAVFARSGEHRQVRISPRFEVRSDAAPARIFRDLPTKAFILLLKLTLLHDPGIALAVAMQAFAGLREGEVLNVRQVTSPLGPGLLFRCENNRVREITIDITHEFVLRADGRSTGRIKRPRRQVVYPAFNEIFMVIYRKHLKYLRNHPFDPAYCPMFPDARGQALRYDAYLARFQQLVRIYLVPELLESSDPELKGYGLLLSEHRLACHTLRHCFSIFLVELGEDLQGLQFYRGDASLESSQPYLNDKSDLKARLRQTQSELIELLTAMVSSLEQS